MTTRTKSKQPTIRDVSKLAGVSRMTVSRVTSDPTLVLPATREKVIKAIADLGYVPDRTAGSLSSRRTGFIALMLPTLTNANFAAVAHGLTDVLRQADYQLLIAYTEYDMAEEGRQLRNLLGRRPEAIVLTGATHNRETTRMLLASDIPIIEIADLASGPIEHVIGFSNHQVGRTAARYLIDRGFTRIGASAGTAEGTVVDHRGEGRRLAGAGRPGHQHHTARVVGNALENLRRFQIFQREDFRGDGTEHRTGAAGLVKSVDAEAGETGDFEGEVTLKEFFVVLALLVVHDVVDEIMNRGVVEGRHVDTPDVTIDPNHGRQAGRQMQVGSAVLDAES